MKNADWNGHRIPLLVHFFNTRLRDSIGVAFKLKAADPAEAKKEAGEILAQHHKNFLKKTGGYFDIKFERLI